MVQEYRRTCHNCGKVWHSLISREKEIQRRTTMCCSDDVNCCGGSAQKRRNIDANKSSLDKLKSCPDCGFHNYGEVLLNYDINEKIVDQDINNIQQPYTQKQIMQIQSTQQYSQNKQTNIASTINYGRKLSQAEQNYLNKLNVGAKKENSQNIENSHDTNNVQKSQVQKHAKETYMINAKNVNYGRKLSQAEQNYLNKINGGVKNINVQNGEFFQDNVFVKKENWFSKLSRGWQISIIAMILILMMIGGISASNDAELIKQKEQYQKTIDNEKQRANEAEAQLKHEKLQKEKEQQGTEIKKQKEDVIKNDENIDIYTEKKQVIGEELGLESWNEGGTLHNSSVSEWKIAGNQNKLATSADFLAACNGDLSKSGVMDMNNCIDILSGTALGSESVAGLAALCCFSEE